MGDFRRVVTALALLALFVGVAAAQTANQPFTCTASTSVPPTVRWEGYTELVGDVVLTCTGGLQSQGGLANITVYTNTAITSRLLGAGTATSSGNATEALLLIDEPNSVNGPAFAPCSNNVSGCGAGTLTGSAAQLGTGGFTSPNVFQGVWGVVNPNAITFYGVPVIPPGTNGPTGTGTYVAGTRTFRITNVRVNANALSNSNVPTPVTAYVSINSSSAVPVNNPNQIVGYVQSGLTTLLTTASSLTSTVGSGGVGYNQCTNRNTGTGTRSATAILNYSENFGNAFKTRTQPGSGGLYVAGVPGAVNNNSESGFMYNGTNFTSGSFIAGLADSGTRFKAVFNNIPNGISTIYVSLNNISATASNGAYTTGVTTSLAQFVGSNDQIAFYNTGNSFVTTTSTDTINGGSGSNVPAIAIPVVNNSATAVWEITASNPSALETFSFAFAFGYTANVAANLPAPGTATVSMSLAPTVGPATASATAPIPRFADTSTARNLFNIAACRSVLLFPFVTNQAGFDTGIAISNTSTDPFGTTPQAGTCTLNFYGANAPAQAYTSPSVPSGTSWTDLASIRSPGFQGYMFAVCNFQYAHGFAFISDVGARNLAMGYLALVIEDPGTGGNGRPATSSTDTNKAEAAAF